MSPTLGGVQFIVKCHQTMADFLGKRFLLIVLN